MGYYTRHSIEKIKTLMWLSLSRAARRGLPHPENVFPWEHNVFALQLLSAGNPSARTLVLVRGGSFSDIFLLDPLGGCTLHFPLSTPYPVSGLHIGHHLLKMFKSTGSWQGCPLPCYTATGTGGQCEGDNCSVGQECKASNKEGGQKGLVSGCLPGPRE